MSFVLGNPVLYTDPSGNRYLDPADNSSHPAPSIIVDVDVDLPMTQAEKEKYYKLAYTPGWWNNYKTGVFTVLDYLQLLLRIEFNGGGAPSSVLQETVVRDFYARCFTFCNISNPRDLLRYIALKGLNGGKRNETPQSLAGQENKPRDPTDFYSAITHPNADWSSGCGNGNVPCNWGNKSMATNECPANCGDWAKAIDWDQASYNVTHAEGSTTISTDYNHFYYKFGDNSPGSNFFFIVTANQANWLYPKLK